MKQKIISDTGLETLTVKWDDERLGIVLDRRYLSPAKVILLNPVEALELSKFIQEELSAVSKL